MLKGKELLLEDSLLKASNELDLPVSKYELAIQRYETIGKYLGEENTLLANYDPIIFPQGSFRLGTVIRPYNSDEYDIDLVCQLNIEKNIGQKNLYEMVGNRLSADERYKKILKPKRRCWSLNYANEFHMDILPAIPNPEQVNNAILIPDRELATWQHSNPKDYTEWFYSKMKSVREGMILEARLEIEKVPFYNYKTPLQRVVQILKHHRDVLFEKDQDDKPISIIITTLAAKAYRNEVDISTALINIIDSMPRQFDNINGEVVLLNPVNDKENFADKWTVHKQRKTKFFLWLDSLKKEINESMEVSDSRNYILKMGALYGANLADTIVRQQKILIEENYGIKTKAPIVISDPPKSWKK